jgi:hypothetical protein
MSFITDKHCMECGTPYRGRPDKKFCTDQCRTTYNNRLNRDEVNCIRNVNNTLRRNRRILLSLNPTGKIRVRAETLRSQGFDFNHFTSLYRTRDGRQYFYCYDQGYTPVDRDWYLLVIRQEFMV